MNTLKMRVAAAALLMGTASAAPAREYTLMIYERGDQLALRNDAGPKGQAYWSAFAGIGQDMAKAGVLRGGSPLDPPPSDTTLKLSGYLIVDVADTAAAQAWAAKIPAAATGRIDIYPHAASKTGM
jgi:hypothetical protein